MHFRRSYKSARKAAEVVQFPAANVWAAAQAAQRINGEYLKESKTDYNENYEPIRTREANKVVMRKLIMETPELITGEDRAQGAQAQQYFQCKMMDVLADRANDFTRTAMELANREEFASNDWLALATVACLPQSYLRGLERDARNEKKMDAQMVSQHFGKVGDRVQGDLTVLESRYSQKWGTWYVSGTVGTNVVLFAYRNQLESGSVHKFNGSIKAHRDDNVTQLNRVRLN